MSAIVGLEIGKAIFNILNVSAITDIPGMTAGKIQPAPLIDQANPTLAQEADIGTYNTIKINGITMETASEDYNKNRRYYSKNLSFQAIVLL